MARPGTVSKILWHFTGGPLWDDNLSKQGTKLKPDDQAYEALKSILSSRELQVGKYKEIVKIILPIKHHYNIPTKTFDEIKDLPITINSRPVCCVTDIPIQHLAYPALRFGKMAIGFYREAIVRTGFNPVLYTLEEAEGS